MIFLVNAIPLEINRIRFEKYFTKVSSKLRIQASIQIVPKDLLRDTTPYRSLPSDYFMDATVSFTFSR